MTATAPGPGTQFATDVDGAGVHTPRTSVASRFISSVFSTLTRPANVTAYVAGNSISNDSVAGNVTPLVATVTDLADAPACLTEMLLGTTDTGLAAGISVRAFLFNSDPTANSGVGAGNGAAWSNKRAGFIGSMSGTFRAFSDGGEARLVPDEGNFIIAKPAAGAMTMWVQYQTLGAFTPSANSTIITAEIRGLQGRA